MRIGLDQKKRDVALNLNMANRHGLIAGATGTGKTVTLQKLAEEFSKAGVPVFTADIKGDLSGVAKPGLSNEKVLAILKKLNVNDLTAHGNPTLFWDLKGDNGLPLRATISDMGPILLARILNANETQQGVIDIAFSIADAQGLLLLDIKDMQAMLKWMDENRDDIKKEFGNVSSTSIGALQRSLLQLEKTGGDLFFGEPALEFKELFATTADGHGMINILDATSVITDGRLYSTFLLWLLSELFENLPEVGDLDKPKLVFIFDEAHLLFDTAPKHLLEKIEQMMRLIRSKGVGVYFVTQSPTDIPDDILGQLGNRFQHALRAFTPKDQKNVKAAAETFRENPELDTEKEILNLGVGEALVSILETDGTPSVVEKVSIIAPASQLGPISNAERQTIVTSSPLHASYSKAIDRESAHELLAKRVAETVAEGSGDATKGKPGRPRDTIMETITKSAMRSLSSSIGRQIARGILGAIMGKR